MPALIYLQDTDIMFFFAVANMPFWLQEVVNSQTSNDHEEYSHAP